MAVRNFNCYFQKAARQVANTKIQEFINRTRQVKATAVNIFFVKKNRKQVYSCTTLKAFAYHQWCAYHSLRTTDLNQQMKKHSFSASIPNQASNVGGQKRKYHEKYWFRVNLNCIFRKPNLENIRIYTNFIRIGLAVQSYTHFCIAHHCECHLVVKIQTQ